MTFRDAKLREHCERTAALLSGWRPEELPLIGLVDAWQCFSRIEGEDSPRAAEAMEHILSAELRPVLRQWYRRAGENMNEAAMRFRDRLSELAGEKLG